MLLTGFASLIRLSTSLSELAGFTSRVCELFEALQTLEASPHLAYGGTHSWPLHSQTLRIHSDDLIEFSRVSYSTPKGTLLAKDLSFSVARGSSLLVMGTSGCGKSSLLRVLCGIWPAQGGELRYPSADLFVLPQPPYIFDGTLREQCTYPTMTSNSAALVDSELIQLLALLDLSHLLPVAGGLDSFCLWSSILSAGEKQRIAVVRLLFHKPAFALLDEATSALDEALEERVYQLLQQRGSSYVTVGHRPALRRHHQQVLHLDGPARNGSWTLLPASSNLTPACEG
jgi:ABC-type uncharacterized transport system fused permease/ATPase subunit